MFKLFLILTGLSLVTGAAEHGDRTQSHSQGSPGCLAEPAVEPKPVGNLLDLLKKCIRCPNGTHMDESRGTCVENLKGMTWFLEGWKKTDHCVQIGKATWQIDEPTPENSSSHGWFDNFLCFDRDYGIEWRAKKAPNMFCTQLATDCGYSKVRNTYLCSKTDHGLKWSAKGPIPGMNCVNMLEPWDGHCWDNAYLCAPK